jgi:sugar fermentation stimulation protein A
VEVKSCTLFGERMAMFPDAPSERASRHIRHLAEMGGDGQKPGLLIIVHSRHPRYFLPDFHTDLEFAKAFLEARDSVEIKVAGIEWDSDLNLRPQVSMLEIPWPVLQANASDRGGYLLVMELEEDLRLSVGSLGELDFPSGYYCYVGSALKNLSARMSRHLRKRKNFHWHIDYLRDRSIVVACLPVRSAEPVECKMAGAMKGIAEGSVPGFGSSDCACASHLFRFNSNPLRFAPFIDTLLHFRIDRLA